MDVSAGTPVLPALAELMVGGLLFGSVGPVVAGLYLMVRLNRRAR